MSENENDLEMTEAEKASLAASHAAISDLATAMVEGADPDTAAAALAAVRQAGTQIDLDALRDKIHMPTDAAGFEDELRAIMLRIPDRWGRWISCSRGWYPLLVQLDRDLAAVDPDYVLKQCKEKFGGLRYYFHSELDGARERMNELVRAAETTAEQTCDLCGEPGTLYLSEHSWYRTLCASCAAAGGKGYRPANEEVQELTAELPGTWQVFDGDAYTIWDLGHAEHWAGDVRSSITTVLAWPRVGEPAVVELEGGEVRETGTVTRIKRVR